MTTKLRVIYYSGGKMRDLEGYVKDVEISGDTAQAYRSCSLSLNNTKDGRKSAIPFKNGGEIRVHYGKVEFFRGILFENTVDSTGAQSLRAYDSNVYLTKSSDTVRFVGKTATQIIAALCAKYGIKTGALANTKHVIPRFIIRGKTLYEIAVTALTETQKATGKRYRFRNVAGNLELVEVMAQVKRLTVENKRNILDASFTESIEDVKTRVKLTGGDEDKPVTVEVSAPSAKEFGVMQHYEHNSDVKSAAKLKPLADRLLTELSKPKQEFSVNALGDIDIVSAMTVIADEAMTGIRGAFYVASDSHKFEASGLHTMSLTLSRELELPRIDYEDPTESKSGSGGSGDVGSVAVSSAGFIKPAAGRLTSGFAGKRPNHKGIDIAAGGTVTIKAAADGKVSRSWKHATLGECVMIVHNIRGQTYETTYAHMRKDSRKVEVGDTVKQGQAIGLMGSTGRSTGQHLHFEVHKPRWNGTQSNAVNPLNYVKI